MKKFGVIGFGKMGGAFAAGVEELFEKDEIVVFDKFEGSVERAKARGYSVAKSAAELVSESENILISVKPQDLTTALSGLSAEGKLVVSIAAGVKIAQIEGLMRGAKVARVMPNTCATIKMCMSTVAFSDNCGEVEKKVVFDILNALGGYMEVAEDDIDNYLAVGGSFTAYAYLYLKEFALATAKRGCDFEKALTIAAKTAQGAAEMILRKEKSVDELIKDVCSKGGTTLAGLEKLDVDEFSEAIDGCVNACCDRSIELSKFAG